MYIYIKITKDTLEQLIVPCVLSRSLQAIQYGRELSYITLTRSLIKCKLMTKYIV